MSTAPKPLDLVESGLAHHFAGRYDKAETAYKRAIGKNPKDASALHLLGLLTADKGRFQRALQLIEKALAVDPENPNFLHSAGHVLAQLGRLEEAVDRYRAALETEPDRPLTLSNLGNALKHLGHMDDAAHCLARAVELDIGFAEGWSNLGLVEKARGAYPQAKTAFERAMALRPENPNFRFNLANAEREAGDLEAAIAGYKSVIAQDPSHGGAHLNLAATHKIAGDFERADASLQFSIKALPPDHPQVAELHWNLAINELTLGHWQRGWEEFEWRHKMPDYGGPEPKAPLWSGDLLAGRRIIINHEQGLGDAFQFLRYAGDLAAQDGYVIYRGPKSMGPIAKQMTGIQETVAFEDPLPDADCWAPMMSLPRLLKLEAETFARARRLTPDAALLEPYRERLEALSGLKIGIWWQGNPEYRGDRERTIPLQAFQALAALPGVHLVALQKGPGAEQTAEWPQNLPLLDLGPEIDGAQSAFTESAAVIDALDLVVGCDTALAHLAGALGKEIHLALSKTPDWRWGLEGERCVWYPTMTLHRQTRAGDWQGVFERIKALIEERSAGHG
ncbi:MAG: tetratricopeptide repeat protein [Alphaproteobacteria bacterium]|nr:tetratricopeptide repeat protein [Alphaproteobacteria bacterium]